MFIVKQFDVLAAMQEATRPGGINIVSDLTTDGPLYTQWHNKHESWISEQELFDRYGSHNWEILAREAKRVPTIEADRHGTPLWNQSATVVAQKSQHHSSR